MVTQLIVCSACGSTNVIRFGTNASGKQRYRCRTCKKTFVQHPAASRLDDPVFVAQVLACYQERASMRGVARVFGISRNTLADLIKKSREPS